MPRGDVEPYFNRSEVAKILNCAPLTISNREKAKKYPAPKRDLNNYRVYTLNDVMNLQLITFQAIDTRPIMSLLFDKGYHDPKIVTRMIDGALARRRGLV